MPEQLQVCFISRKWPPAMGGMETYAFELATALEKMATLEKIVLPGHSDGSVPGAGQLLRFAMSASWRLLTKPLPTTVIHAADMASWPLAAIARLRRRGSRVVLSANGTDVSYPLRGGMKGRAYGAYLRLGRRLLHSVTVIANSQATASHVRRYGFNDVRVVPLAANVIPVDGGSVGRTIVFSGRLVKLKGCAWFIQQVLPHLPDDIMLEVAGTKWDATEAEALDNPRVRFLGKLDQQAMWRKYATALCVVVPNITMENGQFEGFGLVAVEGAAAGGVVVAARHGGLIDAVRDGTTGFLLTSDAPDPWINKIREIAEWSAEKRADFTNHAQSECIAYYNWARVADETLAAYQQGARE